MRNLILLLIITVSVSLAMAGETETAPVIADRQAAIEYLRNSPTDFVEGIWEFPEDETTVLIKRGLHNIRQYDIIILSTPDCRLTPGETIGTMEQTADRNRFKLHLYISRKYGALSDIRTCAGIYNEKSDALLIEPRKISLKMSTPWFLPKFWRSIRVRVSDPAASLPKGLLKIYPRQEPEKPIYL